MPHLSSRADPGFFNRGGGGGDVEGGEPTQMKCQPRALETPTSQTLSSEGGGGRPIFLLIINGTLLFLRKINLSLLLLRKINWR